MRAYVVEYYIFQQTVRAVKVLRRSYSSTGREVDIVLCNAGASHMAVCQ